MNFSKRDNKGMFVKGHKQPKGSKHKHWKGDKATYSTVHWWINRYWEHPQFCEKCGAEKTTRFEWANISGKYKRVRSDWLSLCVSCHRIYDDVGNKVWAARRRNKTDKRKRA